MSFSLFHLIRQPKVIESKNPLILLLHGYGSNEEDLFSFANELPDNYYVISARAPYDLMYGSYAWYSINFDADENKFSDIPQAIQSRDLIKIFIEELIENYSINPSDITLMGFSQGCILSYAVALSYPQLIRKVVAMSGYFNEEIVVENYKNHSFENLKIFASHGSVDQVIPVTWARNSIPKIKELGINIEFKEYPVGHGVAPQNFFDLLNWLKNN